MTKNFARSRRGSESACSESVMVDFRRTASDDSVSSIRAEREARRSERVEFDVGCVGSGIFEGEGAATSAFSLLLPYTCK